MHATILLETLHKKMKFPILDFFSKCDQICRKLYVWSHLPRKSLMENFISCAVRDWSFTSAERTVGFELLAVWKNSRH